MKKDCNYCQKEFNARRKNHIYCSNSCKTLASYKRNNYKYITGHYQKNSQPLDVTNKLNNQVTLIESKVKEIENKQNKTGLNKTDIKNTTAGALLADASIYGLKKVFAPNTLPATKSDVENLKNEITSLKKFIIQNSNKF